MCVFFCLRNHLEFKQCPANLREKNYRKKRLCSIEIWLVVSTHLKNISQNGNLPQIGVKTRNI